MHPDTTLLDLPTFAALLVMAAVAFATWRWFDLLFPRRREPDLSGMTSAERVAWFERGLRREIASQNDARLARETAQRTRELSALDDVQRRASHEGTEAPRHQGIEPDADLRLGAPVPGCLDASDAPRLLLRITALQIVPRSQSALPPSDLRLPPSLDLERVEALDIPRPDKRRIVQAMLATQMPHLRPMAR